MTPRARWTLATLALIALLVTAYAPVITRGVFIWDDHALIERNTKLHEGSLANVFRQPFWSAHALSDLQPSYYRPFTKLSLRADDALFGSEAPSFHLTNVALHVLATLALIGAGLRLGATPTAALLGAFVWALNPRVTESVAWISGRGDVLAGLFSFAAITLWPWIEPFKPAKPAEEMQTAETARGPTRLATRSRLTALRAFFAALAVFGALLSKEVGIAIALALGMATAYSALGDASTAWRDRIATLPRALPRLVWLAVPLAIYGLLRFQAMRGSSAPRLTNLGVVERGVVALEALGRYVAMIADPWHPASSIGLIGDVAWPSVILGALALMAAIQGWMSKVARKSEQNRVRSAWIMVVAFGCLAIGLVLHLFPIGLASAVAADRLLYLPLAALGLGLALAASAWQPPSLGHRRALGLAVLALVTSFVPVTYARATDYTDELTFRVAAAEHAHTRNTSTKSALATTLRADGETALACKLHDSVRLTLERLGQTATPRYFRALENVGSCEAALGEYEKAAKTYAVLTSRSPGPEHVPAQGRLAMELGYLHLHTFDLDRAEHAFVRALIHDATLEPARASLAAIAELRLQVIRFSSNETRAQDPVGWARLLASLGRLLDAEAAWARIAEEPHAAPAAVAEAVRYLAANGSPDLAARVLAGAAAAQPPQLMDPETAKKIAVRVERHTHVEALKDRIEALAK